MAPNNGQRGHREAVRKLVQGEPALLRHLPLLAEELDSLKEAAERLDR